jgi:methionine-rich copper-binding protein CopC
MHRAPSVLKYSLPLLAILAACSPVEEDRSASAAEAGSGAVLIRSIPANGATVRAPQSLSLTFSESVRLAEVTITGPSGEMPMMITAAGEQRSYAVPLPDLEPGRHEVRWRVLARGGVSHEGRLSFTVR